MNSNAAPLTIDGDTPSAEDDADEFIRWLESVSAGRAARNVQVSGVVGGRAILRTLSLLRPYLEDRAEVMVADADFASVYESLVDIITIHPEYAFEDLIIAPGDEDRPGRASGHISFRRGRSERQRGETVPVNKHKQRHTDDFDDAMEVVPLAAATALVRTALARWHADTPDEATRRRVATEREFPDDLSVLDAWHTAGGRAAADFFVWGHDHDFGFDQTRRGAMSTRHVEIVAEALSLGMLPRDLGGCELLDVGCWTGGDVLGLSGLGANVTAIDEHPVAARAAAALCKLVDCGATVVHGSLYDERLDWVGRFDVIYCSGVVYHVSDPLLLLRICFAYLKPGGRVIIETKAQSGAAALCGYAGTFEKGWNWYSPSRATLGRWLVDAGFPKDGVELKRRSIGRLLAVAKKSGPAALPDATGFSRPGHWLADEI